jgi:hypothetical protein
MKVAGDAFSPATFVFAFLVESEWGRFLSGGSVSIFAWGSVVSNYQLQLPTTNY